MRTTCPLCGKSTSDQLPHLRVVHNIEDASQFMKAIRGVELGREHREQFARYADELWEKKTKGLITAEDYRRLIMEWAREHDKES